MAKKLCFVVMGFGKKTDYSEVPRTLDMDATHEAIIKPAVTGCGLDCVRADEVTHSGIIDKPMYEMLLRADLVIADISTANPNALYELGVRHALRPFSTIVIKEIDGKFIFDLNHLATLQYKHLGDDIGAKEAKKKVAELQVLIRAVLAKQDDDSPVYTFLKGLKGPVMSGEDLQGAIASVKAQSDSLAQAIDSGRQAAAESRSRDARDYFKRAYDIQVAARNAASGQTTALPDPYIIQQLALHTYKAKPIDPSENPTVALRQAQRIIDQLNPSTSTDPETLGITGAIQKRLYSATKDRTCLDSAVEFYGRGFDVKRDYYNGENYAVCLDWRAEIQVDPTERTYDRQTARKVRARIVDSLTAQFADPHTAERQDYKWMLATMANTLYALGRDGASYEQQFLALNPADWERSTFAEGKAAAQKIAVG